MNTEDGPSRQKLPVKNAPYSRTVGNQYVDDDEEDDNEEEEDEEELGDDDGEHYQNKGIEFVGKEVDDDDDYDEDADVDEEDDDEDNQKNYSRRINDDLERHPKKRKLKSIASSYEFAPRIPAHPSLRSEKRQEVAEKVSEMYKKEKINQADMGGSSSKWVYFKKMDMLMSTSAQQEYVFMNPGVYLNRANGLDEMRDSPGNSESADEVEDDSDGLAPKKRKSGRDRNEGSSCKVLADSIQKLMLELEKMRTDFHRDLEMQKRQIMERAQAEIAKIRQGDTGISADNVSG
ncbi:hypothetical protein MANES_04G123201v8 [Manihot esculenta]|uniref:Uncharacterized protein n=1 Tax=Manihot esculenta TaxID=3983 RepID=A0ACB7HW49_MANES|nr:hypothetical protein MANES_04G123201v8 [Manihot esculenta]